MEGWERQDQVSTEDINISKWKAAHSPRETFFIGPDHYIYNNASNMKKFVEKIEEERSRGKLCFNTNSSNDKSCCNKPKDDNWSDWVTLYPT